MHNGLMCVCVCVCVEIKLTDGMLELADFHSWEKHIDVKFVTEHPITFSVFVECVKYNQHRSLC